MNINCIIVDDEPIARDILKRYIEQVPYLTLVASCEDAFEAMQVLNTQDIDLIILDINMPRLTGFEMLRTLKKYPAVIRLWENAWAEFVPFLSFDVEIRKVICSTNAIESVNARIRKAVRARGHFPNEAAAMKCVYMALMSLDPTGKGRKRWTMRWKAPLNAFQIAFEGRLTPAAN